MPTPLPASSNHWSSWCHYRLVLLTSVPYGYTTIYSQSSGMCPNGVNWPLQEAALDTGVKLDILPIFFGCIRFS